MRVHVSNEIKSVMRAVEHLRFFTTREMTDKQLEAFEEAAYVIADCASDLADELSHQRNVHT